MTAPALRVRSEQGLVPEHRLTFSGLVRSEWIKFWSVRSTVVSMVLAAVLMVGVGMVLAVAGAAALEEATGAARAWSARDVEVVLLGAQLAALLVAAVGVIAITGEYSTGAIRTSLAVVPRRLPVLWAKATVLAVVVPLVLGAAVLVTFFAAQAIMSTGAGGVGIGDPEVLRLLLGNVVVLTGTALAGLGLGAVLRSTAGAVCTILGLVFVLPTALMAMPAFPGKIALVQYNFGNAASALTTTSGAELGAPPVAAGVGAFALWTAFFLLCGAIALHRRDA